MHDFCSNDCGCRGNQVAAYCMDIPACARCRYIQQPGEAQGAERSLPRIPNWFLFIVGTLVAVYFLTRVLTAMGCGQ